MLLFTFIGGVGFFFGPMIGAVIGVFLTVMLSEFTQAWQLYLGVFFIIIVMYAPGGVASLLMMNVRVARFGKFGRVLARPGRPRRGDAGGLRRCGDDDRNALPPDPGQRRRPTHDAASATESTPPRWSTGCIAAGVFALGALAFRRLRQAFLHAWGEVNSEIEDMIRRAQA